MKDTEIINYYNNLDQYAKDRIDRQLIDLTNAKKESRNYCIKVCPKCGAVDPGFTKGGNANSGKPMLKCRCCHKRFTYDNGQLTLFPPGRIKVGPAYRRYIFSSANRKIRSEYEYQYIYSLAYANEAVAYA